MGVGAGLYMFDVS